MTPHSLWTTHTCTTTNVGAGISSDIEIDNFPQRACIRHITVEGSADFDIAIYEAAARDDSDLIWRKGNASSPYTPDFATPICFIDLDANDQLYLTITNNTAAAVDFNVKVRCI